MFTHKDIEINSDDASQYYAKIISFARRIKIATERNTLVVECLPLSRIIVADVTFYSGLQNFLVISPYGK